MSRTTVLVILALSLLAAAAPTVSAAATAVGPCSDPGAAALVRCATANGEDLACNATVGDDDCVRGEVCSLYWVDPEQCFWPNDDLAATGAAAVALGPCDDPGALAVAECAAYNGEVLVCNALNGNDDCIRPQDAEKLVCNLLFGTDDCLAIVLPALGTSSAAIGIGPCDDPGAVALVQCAEENGEVLLCSAVFGDQSTCITTMCRMMLDNCPLDPKGPIEATAARVDLPAEFPAAA